MTQPATSSLTASEYPMFGVMENVNQEVPLHYRHDDHTKVLRDVRKTRSVDVPYEQVFYVVFSIWYAWELHYHHAVILADDDESFTKGIAEETQLIVDRQLACYKTDVSVVFVRSLLMQRQDIKDSATETNIRAEIQDGVSPRNDDKFMAVGLFDDNALILITVEAGDALKAIEIVRKMFLYHHQKKFTPIEICQAHPVTAECYVLFDIAAPRIKALIDAKPCLDGSLH